MNKITYYFKSISGFNRFLVGLKRRLMELYFRYFSKVIKRKISMIFYDYDNKKFISNLHSKITLPNNISKNYYSDVMLNELFSESDEIISGYIDLLGSGKVLLEPHSWHKDFKTGFEWPKGIFFRDYDQEVLDNKCDVKVPRELSRSHHILKVALAYFISKDEKYAKYCKYQIVNWIDENPLMFSINWGCTMDVAIRAINWIWILRLISDSKSINDDFIEKIRICLYEHGWYIYRNPEKGVAYNHNHYLSDLSGQIYLGLLFNDLAEPKKWLREAKDEFYREIRLQILPSGMSYERSTNYNRLVLELCIWPILILKNNYYEIPTDIWFRMEQMFEFIMLSLKPDGNTPIIGDQDNGRLLIFGPDEKLNLSYLLSLGAILFNRSDFKSKSNGFNFYTLFSGLDNPEKRYETIDEKQIVLNSKLFSDIGIAIIRNPQSYLLFNASGMAKYPESDPGSHTHSDLLSFELYTLGKTFIVDPGTFLYTADIKKRMLFRSTKMHNTVTVDGYSQNNLFVDKPWYFERNAIPKIHDWQSGDNEDLITASHNGYSRLKEPIIHKRMIKFNKNNEEWLIRDELIGSGKHQFKWYFHFDVGIDFEIKDNFVITLNDDNKNISLLFSDIDKLELKKEQAFVSKSYGSKQESNVLTASLYCHAPVNLTINIKKYFHEANF